LLAEVALEEHLHGEFAGFAAGAHFFKDRLSEFQSYGCESVPQGRPKAEALGYQPLSRTVMRDPRLKPWGT
jgi:hypothetical protein